MPFRSCIYKGCKNGAFQATKDNKLSIFKFPKNPERRLKWMEMGQAPNNLPKTAYYYCSAHFDRKFLSINNRRTLLVGEAIPRAYSESNYTEVSTAGIQVSLMDEETTHDSNEQTSETSSDAQQFKLEYIRTEEENECTLVENTLHNSLNKPLVINTDNPMQRIKENSAKRPSTEENNYDKTIKRKPIPNISSTQDISLLNECSNRECNVPMSTYNVAENTSDLINAEHISTFTFKGEEFVQMSKEYYINEKTELLKKIRLLKRVLRAVKSEISLIDCENE